MTTTRTLPQMSDLHPNAKLITADDAAAAPLDIDEAETTASIVPASVVTSENVDSENSDEIMADSNEILDHIAQALKNHQELAVVHVVGHTDAKGSADHNMKLSEKRAAAVVAALKERGVTQQIDARGAGKNEPTCSEDTDECHEKNRRVEFIVAKAGEEG